MIRVALLENGEVAAEWKCDAAIEEIRIGRDPERCHVAIPAEAHQVSREHCALRLVLGRYRVILNQENPVFVNGKPAFEGQVLPESCMLRLGKNGPLLRIQVDQQSALPSTMIVAKERQRAPREIAQEVLAPERKKRVWLGVGVGAAIAISIFTLDVVTRTSAAVDALIERPSTLEEEARIRQVVAPEVRPAEFAAVLDASARSVYLVLVDRGTTRTPIGTAWVLDRARGRLATCAHVVRGTPTEKLYVRGTGENPVDLGVQRVTSHPGYERFEGLRQRFALPAFVVAGHNTGALIPAEDVAWIEVGPADRERLGPDLALAPREDLEAIASGHSIASLGHPLEGVSGNYERPVARSQIGHVLASSDYFLGWSAPKDAKLLHVSIALAGGASGSPVFDAKGRVLGIASAASFAFLEQGASGGKGGVEGGSIVRVPTGIVNYAQRADVLAELLEGIPDPVLEARVAAWERAMAAMRELGERDVVTELLRSVAASLAGAEGKPLRSEAVVARARGELVGNASKARKSFDLKAKQGGYYVAIATTVLDEDLDLTVRLEGGPARLDGAIGSRAVAVVPATRDAALGVTVFTKAQAAPVLPFELVVVRLEF